MRSIHVLIALVIIAPQAAAAQAAGPATAVAAQDTVQPAPKKKGGLFGKMKGLAKSKVVNTVAKVALCTAVPGGSMIASAVEAKKAKGVKEAAGAAANLAGGASGSCMPGMGLAGKAGAAANAAGVPGVGVPGLPTTGLSSAALSAGPMNGMQGMTAASLTPGQLKQMEEQYRKMGMKPDQIKAMELQIQAMQQTTGGPTEATEIAPAPATALPPAAAVAAAGPGAVSNEHGHLTLRGLSWMPATAVIRPDAQAGFSLAMRDMAAAIQGSGKRYSIQARVEEQGKKAQNRTLSHQRAAAVLAGLVAEGISAARLKLAEGGSDKDARILIQETK
jgi:OmpA family